MAQQQGIIPLKGTIGNITFYKSGDGYLAREKGGISAERMASDPAFQRTRENGAEFGRAGIAGKTLRTALKTLLQKGADRKMVSRLTREMVKVIQADTVNPRGMRKVMDAQTQLLLNFEFNINGKLSSTFHADFKPAIDRVTGELSVTIPSFIPKSMLDISGGATHFIISMAALEIDFDKQLSITDVKNSAVLPWDDVATTLLTLTGNITPNSTSPLFIAMGVEFYQKVNGSMYPLKNGSFNPVSLVAISGV